MRDRLIFFTSSFGNRTGGQEQEEKEGTEQTEGRCNRGGDAWTDEALLTRHVTPECKKSQVMCTQWLTV